MISDKKVRKASRSIYKLLGLLVVIAFVGSILFLPEGAKVSDVFVKFIEVTRGLGLIGLGLLALIVFFKYGREAKKEIEKA